VVIEEEKWGGVGVECGMPFGEVIRSKYEALLALKYDILQCRLAKWENKPIHN